MAELHATSNFAWRMERAARARQARLLRGQAYYLEGEMLNTKTGKRIGGRRYVFDEPR